MNLIAIFSIGAILGLVMLIAPFSMSFAETSQTTTTPLDDKLSIEKTVMMLTIPESNTLPWAFVEGKIKNHALDFPVIIQFFDEDSHDKPIHIAQTEVNEDGSYEYKFRVRDVDPKTGEITNIFEGSYTVKVFKVIVTDGDLGSA
ncbi:MAG: hypothetical protein OEL69_09700 [Nitrosopumilus sp.]|nr:hypothetical protein [Nitrosopumilus sp.]